mmetsp:Transcript_25775/g.60429  ORF Transcript_25775/g.60429 Transcript_25775/m.60429 type:complete len:614 (-) Transcript_25775:305-2146(-)|eukprot:CAMPEP_0197189150 /NCGR_PEP_ID=MMETSP1423-20130617/19235_1 /TAXON_ID=476441 /ORGANISM="Pseudo-nitzschia heimii, Strain UNC1101" /LENGTH=613 /DNA_ID=CAMNT_0042641189 /DNA_START=100 /DNA_END=1941 /DNA_ORIENTATION=-
MLTRPFTRLVVAFGIRKITQRRLVEEVVTGTLLLIPFGLLVGLLTSRICTKFRFTRIRSDVWTTLVVFLIGDVLMEWLLPSLGCLPMPASEEHGMSSGVGPGDDDGMMGEYISSIFQSAGVGDDSASSLFRQDEYHYTFTWLLQSYGLYCPPDFAKSQSLLTPDATAILFSIRLVFLCIGVHIGESLGCFVALTGGIATGKSTAAKMFVNCNYNNPAYDHDVSDTDDGNGNGNPVSGESNRNNKGARNRRQKSNLKKRGSSSSNSINNGRNDDLDDDELIKIARASEGRGILGWFGNKLEDWLGGLFSAFALTDDGNGGGYNEGTVQLICADSIAHSILLPPEVLADRQQNSSSSSSDNDGSDGGDDDSDPRSYEDDDNHSGDEGDNDCANMGSNNRNSNTDGDAKDDQTRVIRIVSPSDSVYHQILKAFEGKDILNPNNGHIDRLKLGAIIFNDRDERRKLNKITHPRILIVLLKNLVRSVFFGFADITMGDLPLLFESGKLSWLFGITICVATSEDIQLARLIKRNPELSKSECQARIDSQLSLSKKIARADIVIDNDGDLDQLREQVEEARRDIMGRLYGIGMSLLQMLLLIGGSTSIAVSSKFYTHWQQ